MPADVPSAVTSSPGTGALASERSRWSHPWMYLVPALLGLVVLGLSAIPIHASSVSDLERSVFRVVNDRTFVPFVLVWPVMQLGNFFIVPAVGIIAAVTRRFRLCATVLVGGGLVWLLAKLLKRQFGRGRPPTLLPDVHVHGTLGLGFGYPSGHAAVASLVATVCWPYLGRRGRAAAVALVTLVCLARMWVGAHFPLDVVAGCGIGVALGSVVLLVAGRPLPGREPVEA